MHRNSRSTDVKPLDYLDFDLEIGPGGEQEYPVAVVRSPAGEARETMHFPFGERELEDRLKDLQLALWSSGRKRRRVLSQEEQSVQDFGRALFDALLTDEVHSRYKVSHREAADQDKGLRLRLRVRPPEMAALPWEFLYDSGRGQYLCLSRHTPVVRYLELPQPIQPLSVTAPLRILGMVASPRGLSSLDVGREKQRVEGAIEKLPDGLVEMKWLEGQTWRDLQRMMQRGPWHIFHFIGHGEFDRDADEGVIALADEYGQAQRLSATQLGTLLADHRSLRLVLLNACEGARGSEQDIFSSTAAILVQRGIPAVLAMQYEITDEAAIEFARSFYEAQASGMPVDAATAEARKAINIAVPNTLEWGIPVLYMRSPDGVLFRIQARGEGDKSQEGAEHEVQDGTGAGQIGVQEAKRLQALYTQGIEHIRHQSWREAAESFRELIRIDPGYRDAWQRLDEAKENVKKLKDRERRLVDLQDSYWAGRAHYEKAQWEAAIPYLKHIVDSDETYENAAALLQEAEKQLKLQTLYVKAAAQQEEEKWIEAVAALEEIVRVDHAYKDAQARLDNAEVQRRLQNLYNQARDHANEENWDEAIGALETILQENPDYPGAADKLKEAKSQEEIADLYHAGVGFLETGKCKEAIDKFKEINRRVGVYKDVADKLAKAQRKQELDKLFRQGTDHLQQREWQEAASKFEQVRAMDPGYRSVQTRLEEAQKQLRLDELHMRGEASFRAENWQDAVEIFEELRELAPRDGSVVTRLEEAKRQLDLDRLYREGIEHLRRSRWRKAEGALEEVLLLDSGYRDAAAKLEAARESLARSNPVVEILRDPLWQGIGGVGAILALIIAVYPFIKGNLSGLVKPTPTSKPPVLCNGAFEDNLDCWQHGGELDQAVECDGDGCFAVLGNPGYECEGGVPVGEAWINQSFQVPETVSPTLSLKYRVLSYDILTNDLDNSDFFQVRINGKSVGEFGNIEWDESDCTREAWDSDWQPVEFSLGPYRGERVELSLRNVNATEKWWNTWTYVDDIQVH